MAGWFRAHLFRLAGAIMLAGPIRAEALPDFPDDSPFRQGEGFGTPATCETLGRWIETVPDDDGRISMVIEGALRESHWDGALAYLVMCDPAGVQVMCTTYDPKEARGQTLLFAGGYNRYGERLVVLDPCLTYPPDEGE